MNKFINRVIKSLRRRPVVHIKIREGRFNIVGLGVWHSYWHYKQWRNAGVFDGWPVG